MARQLVEFRKAVREAETPRRARAPRDRQRLAGALDQPRPAISLHGAVECLDEPEHVAPHLTCPGAHRIAKMEHALELFLAHARRVRLGVGGQFGFEVDGETGPAPLRRRAPQRGRSWSPSASRPRAAIRSAAGCTSERARSMKIEGGSLSVFSAASRNGGNGLQKLEPGTFLSVGQTSNRPGGIAEV